MIGPTNMVRMDVKSDPPLGGNPLRRGLSSTSAEPATVLGFCESSRRSHPRLEHFHRWVPGIDNLFAWIMQEGSKKS